MNLIKYTFILSLITSSALAQQTNMKAVQIQQDNTLKTLRDFRDNLNDTTTDKTSDSLRRNISKIISFTKQLKDTSQLGYLNEYFAQASYAFQNSNAFQKTSIVKNINQDLSYKIYSSSNGAELNLGPGSVIFETIEVSAAVKLAGKIPTGNYSLCWAYFTGIDQESLIKMGSVSGSSVTFTNPFKVIIKLPGYITFWLLDTNTKNVYKSVPEYLKMTASNRNIELNFIPLNP